MNINNTHIASSLEILAAITGGNLLLRVREFVWHFQ